MTGFMVPIHWRNNRTQKANHISRSCGIRYMARRSTACSFAYWVAAAAAF